MRLIELISKEYITMVETLLEDEEIINDRIILDKEVFKRLLEKYQYIPFREKTKVYKNLNFIIHDKNNYSMPVRENDKMVRKVVINYNTYKIVKHIYETQLK